MSQEPLNKVDQIRQDLACPGCQYNLRGLSGVRVTCPECGQGINIAQLIARKWTGAWYRAPGYSRLIFPLAALVVLGLVAYLFTVMPGQANMAKVFSGLALITWVALIVVVTIREGIEGVALSLLGHLVFSGYIGGLLMFQGGGTGAVVALTSGSRADSASLFVSLVVFVASIPIVLVAYIGERFIAQRCISRYLRKKPTE